MGSLDGKTAVVTGGSSGIGLASARRLVDEGADVYLVGRRVPELEMAVKSIGDRATAVPGDVSRREDLDRLYERITSDGRRVDIVVANAGAVEIVPLVNITEEHVDLVVDTNLKGTIFTVQGPSADERQQLHHPDDVVLDTPGTRGILHVRGDQVRDAILRPHVGQ